MAVPEERDRYAGLNGLASLISKCAVAIGILTTFGYILQIGFVPPGLTGGDIVFLTLVALAFLVIYLALFSYGSVSVIWCFHAMYAVFLAFAYREKNYNAEFFQGSGDVSRWDRHSRLRRLLQCWRNVRMSATRVVVNRPNLPSFVRGWGWGLLSVFLFSSFLGSAIAFSKTEYSEILIGASIAGFLLLSLSSAWDRIVLQPALRVLILLLTPLLIYSIYAGASSLLNIVFTSMGVRIQNASVQVPESDRNLFERAESVLDYPMIDCQPVGTNHLLIHGVTVLWVGVGSQAFIELGPAKPLERGLFEPTKRSKPVVRLPIDAGTAKVLRAEPHLNTCLDISIDEIFDKTAGGLTMAGRRRLVDTWNFISRLGAIDDIQLSCLDDPDKKPIVEAISTLWTPLARTKKATIRVSAPGKEGELANCSIEGAQGTKRPFMRLRASFRS